MAITYVYKNNLYVNITTLNTCRCEFSAKEPFHSEQFTDMRLDHLSHEISHGSWSIELTG